MCKTGQHREGICEEGIARSLCDKKDGLKCTEKEYAKLINRSYYKAGSRNARSQAVLGDIGILAQPKCRDLVNPWVCN